MITLVELATKSLRPPKEIIYLPASSLDEKDMYLPGYIYMVVEEYISTELKEITLTNRRVMGVWESEEKAKKHVDEINAYYEYIKMKQYPLEDFQISNYWWFGNKEDELYKKSVELKQIKNYINALKPLVDPYVYHSI